MAALRATVEFRSDAFPPRPGEEERVNPGLWGEALVEYLAPALEARGFIVRGSFPEDWGYIIALDNPDYPLWVGCGNYQEHPDGFLCFISPPKPSIRRWFRKIETSARVDALAVALDDALKSHPSVHDLRWWSHEE